jgi:O-antigen/teichoic acid export membrane protein
VSLKLLYSNVIKINDKEFLWVFVGHAGTAVLGIFGVKVLTNILGPSQFGILSLANTIVALISTNILFGPLGQGIYRFWSISKNNGQLESFYTVTNQYRRYAIGAGFLATLVLLIVMIVVENKEWPGLMVVAMITGIALGSLGLRISVFLAARKRKLVALLNIANALLKPVLATILVLLLTESASWAMFGYFMATISVVVFSEHYYYRFVSGSSNSSLIVGKADSRIGRNILSYSWPFAAWGVFGWIHMSCDKWALQAFHGTETVGAFAVVSQLAIFPLIFGSGFLSSLFTPIAFQRAGDMSDRNDIVSAIKVLVLMTGVYILGVLVLIALFYMFHYPLVLFISNKEFAGLSFLLPWLTVAWALFYLGQTLSIFGMLANRPKSYIVPKLVSALVAGISTFYFSENIGPGGVVWGLAIAGFVYALWCAIIARNVNRAVG